MKTIVKDVLSFSEYAIECLICHKQIIHTKPEDILGHLLSDRYEQWNNLKHSTRVIMKFRNIFLICLFR